MDKDTAAALILNRWIEANPRLPADTRHVLKTLAEAPIWRHLGAEETTVGLVASLVRSAFDAALSEAARPSVADERADLSRVIKLASDLKRAIKTSSLPGDSVKFGQLRATGKAPVTLELGWHSLREGGYGAGYPLAVVDLLDDVARMVTDHMDNLPQRQVTRRKNRPEIAAFVRNLAPLFSREFGKKKHGTIGTIVGAVFELEAPLDAKAIETILKDSPATQPA